MPDNTVIYHIAVLDEKLPDLHPMVLQARDNGRICIISVFDKQLLWIPWRHLHTVRGSGLGHYIKRLAYRDGNDIIKDAQTSCDEEFDYVFIFINTAKQMQAIIDNDNVMWSENPVLLDYDHNLNPIVKPVSK